MVEQWKDFTLGHGIGGLVIGVGGLILVAFVALICVGWVLLGIALLLQAFGRGFVLGMGGRGTPGQRRHYYRRIAATARSEITARAHHGHTRS